MQELSAERASVRGVSGGRGADCEGSVGVRPVEPELGIEDLGVRFSLHALAGGDSRTAHPRPATNDELGNRTQYVE